jgi:hypothetical protein
VRVDVGQTAAQPVVAQAGDRLELAAALDERGQWRSRLSKSGDAEVSGSGRDVLNSRGT